MYNNILLEAYVYSVLKNDKILFYNPLTQAYIIEKVIETNQKILQDFIKQRFMPISILNENDGLKLLFDELKKKHMISYQFGRGTSFISNYNIYFNNSIERIRSKKILDRYIESMSYLKEISFFINSSLPNIDLPMGIERQIPVLVSNNNLELSLNKIKNIIKQCEYSNIGKINICGGDIFSHSQFKEIIVYFKTNEMFPIFHVYFSEWDYILSKINELDLKEFYFEFYSSSKNIKNISSSIIIEEDLHFNINALIRNEADYNILENLNIENCRINYLPVYNNNIEFFKNNVFVNHEDILNIQHTEKSINTKLLINQLDYGRISIINNGDVYANFSEDKIGNVDHNKISTILAHELTEGNSWLLTRKDIAPCKDCINNAFCPSISNYERVIGKYNLCNAYENESAN